MTIGFINFLRLSPAIALIFGPGLAAIVLYQFINYALMAKYPGFDVAKHRARVARFTRRRVGLPRVAVFVPAAGESVEIVRGTIRAANAIQYPAYDIYLLDDSRKGMYQSLAAELKCEYIRRPNTGHDKKAGNMNYGLSQINGYEWVLVLDADFRARPEILNELMPYAKRDVGIVQSPQHFPLTDEVHDRSRIEYGAAYIQKDFYRITQVARDKYGAAICVGTNALYKVEAVNAVGGWEGVGQPKGWGHSEDVHTGLKMLHAHNQYGERYQIKYIPIQLAEGYCPDNHYSFYKQQNRWCTGSIQLLFSGKTLFSDKLSLSQRIIYGSSSLYYYYTILILTSPLYLLTITLMHQQPQWVYALLFTPTLVTNLVIGPLLLRQPRPRLATAIVVLSNAFTYLQALVLLLRQTPLDWQASGAATQSRSKHFVYFKLIAAAVFALIYLTTLFAVLLDYRQIIGPSTLIILVFLSGMISQVGFMYYLLLSETKGLKSFGANLRVGAAVIASLLLVSVCAAGLEYHGHYSLKLGKYDSISLERVSGPSGYQITSSAW